MSTKEVIKEKDKLKSSTPGGEESDTPDFRGKSIYDLANQSTYDRIKKGSQGIMEDIKDLLYETDGQEDAAKKWKRIMTKICKMNPFASKDSMLFNADGTGSSMNCYTCISGMIILAVFIYFIHQDIVEVGKFQNIFPEVLSTEDLLKSNLTVSPFAEMKILEATYGGKDVISIVSGQYKNGTRKFTADNAVFGDPGSGQASDLVIKWNLNGTAGEKSATAGTDIDLPDGKIDPKYLPDTYNYTNWYGIVNNTLNMTNPFKFRGVTYKPLDGRSA